MIATATIATLALPSRLALISATSDSRLDSVTLIVAFVRVTRTTVLTLKPSGGAAGGRKSCIGADGEGTCSTGFAFDFSPAERGALQGDTLVERLPGELASPNGGAGTLARERPPP